MSASAAKKPLLPDGLVAVVKRDCPTCSLVEPVLRQLQEVSGQLTVYTQDDPSFPAGLRAGRPRAGDELVLRHRDRPDAAAHRTPHRGGAHGGLRACILLTSTSEPARSLLNDARPAETGLLVLAVGLLAFESIRRQQQGQLLKWQWWMPSALLKTPDKYSRPSTLPSQPSRPTPFPSSYIALCTPQVHSGFWPK